MEYNRLGKSGLQISKLSFGSWVTFVNQLDTKLGEKLMHIAYDHGVNFFDNAEAYADGASEELMGEILSNSGWRRDSYIVSTKVFWGGNAPTQKGLSRKHIVDACHNGLKRMKVDYLDLYFCHRPDPETPIEETVLCMNDLIRQGKILYWGTSEWNATQLMEAYRVASEYKLIGPTMEQPQYNMFHRERVEVELDPLVKQFGLGTTIWSPLSSGLLSGKYNKGIPSDSRANLKGFEWIKERFESPEGQEKIKKVQQLSQIAEGLECSMANLAVAWCAKHPNVSTVILGASKQAQLEETLGALELLPKLNEKVMTEIKDILDN